MNLRSRWRWPYVADDPHARKFLLPGLAYSHVNGAIPSSVPKISTPQKYPRIYGKNGSLSICRSPQFLPSLLCHRVIYVTVRVVCTYAPDTTPSVLQCGELPYTRLTSCAGVVSHVRGALCLYSNWGRRFSVRFLWWQAREGESLRGKSSGDEVSAWCFRFEDAPVEVILLLPINCLDEKNIKWNSLERWKIFLSPRAIFWRQLFIIEN